MGKPFLATVRNLPAALIQRTAAGSIINTAATVNYRRPGRQIVISALQRVLALPNRHFQPRNPQRRQLPLQFRPVPVL